MIWIIMMNVFIVAAGAGGDRWLMKTICCGGREEHGSSVCRRHRVHSGMGGTVAF